MAETRTKTPQLAWTEKQRAIAKLLQEGKKFTEVVNEGYNKYTTSKVLNALREGQRPPEEEEISESEQKQGGDGRKPQQTTNLSEATYIRVVPKEFKMTSRVFWDAYEAVINTWEGWRGMSPQEFLDTYLELTLLQRGIFVGGYLVLNKPPQKEENDANVQTS